MKTHENRALFSKALLKAATCLFLTAGIGISAAYAAPRENTQATSIVQQSSTVNGKITDANGEPIIGASVVIKGTTNGTITDFDGNFMLEVPAKATLVVSYVGYKTTNMFWLPLSIQAGMFASIFVYIGYMAKKQAIFRQMG